MSYGLFLANHNRPASKKAVKEAIAAGSNVILENTSAFGNNYDGGLDNAPDGSYTFVGPCPYTKRNFYGTITKKEGRVTVK